MNLQERNILRGLALFLPLDGPRDEEPTGQGARARAEDGEPSLVHVHLGDIHEPRRVGIQELLRKYRWRMSVVQRCGAWYRVLICYSVWFDPCAVLKVSLISWPTWYSNTSCSGFDEVGRKYRESEGSTNSKKQLRHTQTRQTYIHRQRESNTRLQTNSSNEGKLAFLRPRAATAASLRTSHVVRKAKADVFSFVQRDTLVTLSSCGATTCNGQRTPDTTDSERTITHSNKTASKASTAWATRPYNSRVAHLRCLRRISVPLQPRRAAQHGPILPQHRVAHRQHCVEKLRRRIQWVHLTYRRRNREARTGRRTFCGGRGTGLTARVLFGIRKESG